MPMGRLDEPLNTFWQLFYRPNGSVPWSNRVEATATATNGGLVLASAGPSLLVGVRPSVDLTFTPLISTSNGGRSWSDGLVTKELAARPDALATSAGQALALVNSSAGGQVLAEVGGISKWRALVTQDDLARASAGRSCGLGSLTSVGYLGARPLVGGSCGHAGVVGLFAQAHGSWRLAGPTLPSPLDDGRAEVLGLWTRTARCGPGCGYRWPAGPTSVAAWSGPAGGWATSLPLAVAKTNRWPRSGLAAGKAVFALLRERLGRRPAGPGPGMAAPRGSSCRRLRRGPQRSPSAPALPQMRSSLTARSSRPGPSTRARRGGPKTRSRTSRSSTVPRRDQGSQQLEQEGARRLRRRPPRPSQRAWTARNFPLPAADLDAHLAGCPACRDFEAQVATLGRQVALTSARPMPEGLVAVVAAMVEPSHRWLEWTSRYLPLAGSRSGWASRLQWAGGTLPAVVAVVAISMGAGSPLHLVPTRPPSPCTAGLSGTPRVPRRLRRAACGSGGDR